jgi:hypothetical protein
MFFFFSICRVGLRRKLRFQIKLAILCIRNSYILSLLPTGWEKELPKCRDVLNRGRELAQAILRVGEPAAQLQLANTARLALASNLKLVEKGQTSLATGALLPDLAQDYEATQLAVTALLNRVNELKA